MNTDDLNKLPRYIEAPGGGMWGPMPDGFRIANEDAVFVKFKDVEALFKTIMTVIVPEKVIVQDGVEYVSVGTGGKHLIDAAKRWNWTLYSAGCGWPEVTGPWLGDDPGWEYFIKKETDAP